MLLRTKWEWGKGWIYWLLAIKDLYLCCKHIVQNDGTRVAPLVPSSFLRALVSGMFYSHSDLLYANLKCLFNNHKSRSVRCPPFPLQIGGGGKTLYICIRQKMPYFLLKISFFLLWKRLDILTISYKWLIFVLQACSAKRWDKSSSSCPI